MRPSLHGWSGASCHVPPPYSGPSQIIFSTGPPKLKPLDPLSSKTAIAITVAGKYYSLLLFMESIKSISNPERLHLYKRGTFDAGDSDIPSKYAPPTTYYVLLLVTVTVSAVS